MDFITSLPKSKKKNDSFFLVIEKLSKAAHFIPMKSTYKGVNIVDIFLKEIFRLQGIPKEIISSPRCQVYKKILEIFILWIGDTVEL